MRNYYEEDQKLFKAVTGFKAGDKESYYVMYDLSIKYIYKIVFDIIKEHHATEDLVQETYLTIYSKINTLEDVSKFYAWAGRIATNHTFRYIKKNKRELLTLDSEDGAAEFAFEVATQDNEEFIPENILMDKEKQRIISQIIDGLSTEQKLAVQYFYYEEMSVTQIAEAMGCARGTIMSRLNYARKAIKAAVVDLEKNKDTKLYSLGALPLFYIVFRYSVENFTLSATASKIILEVKSALETSVTKEAVAIESAKTTGSVATETTTGAGVTAGTTAGAVAGNGMAVGGAVVSGAAKGILGKIVTGLGMKIVAGVVTAGLLVTGGVMLHKAVTGADPDTKDKKSNTMPMVVSLESVDNKETITIFDDRFSYEYINVKYNNKDITLGFDEDIYQYGYDSYEILSPELKELHNEVCEEYIDAESDKVNKVVAKATDKIANKDIEFTIDDKEFVLHVTDFKVNYDSNDESITIVITGDCETPKNVGEIYTKYHKIYEEKLKALVDAENAPIMEYYMGVLKNLYLYGIDPFGNTIEYMGPYAEAPGDSPEVNQYAIYDMDGDGLVELVVRHTYGDIMYGYNPNSKVIVEEYNASAGGAIIPTYEYYDTGFVVRNYYGYVDVFEWEENTDVYNAKSSIWTCQGLGTYIYGPMGDSLFWENVNNPECIEREQELLNTYDKDGDGSLWVEVEKQYTSEEKVIAYYDNAELEAKINQVVSEGNKINLEFIDISTIEWESNTEETKPENTINSHYMKILEDFYLYGKDPTGFDYSGFHGDTKDYAICDMDGDGVEELIVRYCSYLGIYGYDSNTNEVKEEYSWSAENEPVTALELYENGYALVKGGEGIYVEKISTVTNTSEFLYGCDDNGGINWYQVHMNDPISDEEYLSMYDADGNGVIYMEDLYDSNTDQYTIVYYDDAVMKAKVSEALAGNKPLDIEYIGMHTIVNQQ